MLGFNELPGYTFNRYRASSRAPGELPDTFINMGDTAENVARLHNVTREAMDEFAAESQQRAASADAAGFWKKDITPVVLADGPRIARDESPRPGTTVEKLDCLEPAFREDGRTTAGNCCPLKDGAAALLVMSEDRARREGLKPLARVLSTGASDLSPEIWDSGPSPPRSEH